jgi:hypothetical protein
MLGMCGSLNNVVEWGWKKALNSVKEGIFQSNVMP